MKELENVKRSCRTTRKVIQVMTVMMLVCMVMCLVSAVICAAANPQIKQHFAEVPEDLNNVHISVNVGNNDLTPIAQELFNKGEYGFFFACACLLGGVMTGLVYCVFRMIRGMFDEILNSDSPFNARVLRRMKVSFIVITALVLMSSGLGTGAAVGLSLWCVYTMCQYAAVLQQQADETL